jgi:predicted RNA-binding Zn-ribbon protein involved in translation (DUF1610 family)
MGKAVSVRWPWAVCWICIGIAGVGYAALIGLAPAPSPAEIEAASHWAAKVAPIWLVLWLMAAITAGGVAFRRRRRRPEGATASSRGAVEDGLRETHYCPQCGARLSLRRIRSGSRSGQPQWVCPEHGAVT